MSADYFDNINKSPFEKMADKNKQLAKSLEEWKQHFQVKDGLCTHLATENALLDSQLSALKLENEKLKEEIAEWNILSARQSEQYRVTREKLSDALKALERTKS